MTGRTSSVGGRRVQRRMMSGLFVAVILLLSVSLRVSGLLSLQQPPLHHHRVERFPATRRRFSSHLYILDESSQRSKREASTSKGVWETRLYMKRQTSTSSSAYEMDIQGDFAGAPIRAMKKDVLGQLRGKNFEDALCTIKKMVSFIERVKKTGDATGSHIGMSAIVDQCMQAFTNVAFAQPFKKGSHARKRISYGLEVIQLQLSCSPVLAPPFNTTPRATIVCALRALTGVITANNNDSTDERKSSKDLDDAFRILQRLVTGRGLRHVAADQSVELSERDFNMVLNAAAHTGRMDMAHKIVALQERTQHAPPLSPVAYSILLKGYGRLQDLSNVQMILSHAGMNGLEPDVVMLNSAIDAFVNCNDLESAQDMFNYMRDPNYEVHELSKYSSVLVTGARPTPNRRTYNTILKGLARKGDVNAAMKLAREMRESQMWDDVTTNTLVSAAVKAGDFDLAESVLSNHTAVLDPKSRMAKHPNVEAYTELLDGYAKASELDKALGILEIMGQRCVEPNEYTYSCIIGGLARAKKVDEAMKMLQFMESKNIKPRVVTYNAFISGLVAPLESNSFQDDKDGYALEKEAESLTPHVSSAVKLLPRMLNAGVRPNWVTVSVLVDGLGRCNPPRLAEARAIVTKLRNDGFIAPNDKRVATALIQANGLGNDLKGALENFRRLTKPDLVAVNAFLDACCRCEHEKFAFETFRHYFGDRSSGRLSPDVITYSILIAALLKGETPSAIGRTRVLYTEMKRKRGIMPDNALVDTILTAMVRGGRIGLQQEDIQFALSVLRDAEKLDWEPGQLKQRKQSVRAVLVGRVSEVWKENEKFYGMSEDVEDELFRRKGWNKVDSGFRLWGGGLNYATNPSPNKSDRVVDEFLASKGWNDVDSSFRLI